VKPERHEAIVVGLGAMGSAALRSLAARGVRALGLDRHEPGHDRGSSHGRSRVIRQAYFEHPDYVPLLREAYEGYERLGREVGERLLVRTGGLFAGAAGGEVVEGSRRAAERHGIAHEMLEADAVARRFPALRIPEDAVALFEPGAGFVRAEPTVRAQVGLAVRAGAEVRTGVEVLAIRRGGSQVEIETSIGPLATDRLVVAAGPWADRLLGPSLAGAGVALRVTRQPVVWLETPPSILPARDADFPVWLLDLGGGRSVYGLPPHAALDAPPGRAAGERLVKAAIHGGGATVDPDRVDREIGEAEAEAIAATVRAAVPSAGKVLARSVCLYTYSPDGHFILDRDPLDPRVTIACGFSGHGFKFAPVVGEILADLALDGATRRPTGFLSLGRFRDR
jgi:sarcosine oxidase